MGADHNTRLTGQCEHIEHAVNDNAGPNPILVVECQKVLRIEQVPLSVRILKGMGIDREGLIGDQYSSRVLEWSQGIGLRCHPQLVVFPIDPVRGIVHIENALMLSHLGRPKLIAPGRDQGPAMLLPVRQVGGMEYRKGPSLRRKGTSAVSIIVTFML